MTKNTRNLLLATTAIGFLLAGPAHAASKDDAIKALQAQMNELQKQLTQLQAQQQVQTAKAAEEAPKKEILPGVKVTMGGFVETTGIWRSKNQTQDTSTSFNGNATNTTGPVFDNNANAHRSEFRGSARASRLSLLTEGDVDKDMKLSAFFEGDFLGAAPTANSVQTNSYTPRLRHAFAEVNRKDWGMDFVAGQTWSLATLNTTGMKTNKIATTISIDSGYLPGTIYTRAPQVRVVKALADNKVFVGLSAEEPEVNLGQTTVPTALVSATTTGVSSLNTGAQYSTDLAPDLIGKVAVEPGFGHYEVFGLARFFQNQLVSNFENETVMGAGGGVAAYFPFLSKKLELQASFIGGEGIGRYSAALLPDVAFGADGELKPVAKYSWMVGLVAHPEPTWDVYTYAGMERAFRIGEAGTFSSGTPYGYGSKTVDNNECYEGATGTCRAQTKTVWQVTPGFWKRLYKGNYGTLQAGAQYSFTRRQAFADANGKQPHANQNVVMTAVRYSPF